MQTIYKQANYWPKQSGKFSWSTAIVDGQPDHMRPRPRIIRYEDTWNVMAKDRRSVPFDNWEDARAFALCVFHCPQIGVRI